MFKVQYGKALCHSFLEISLGSWTQVAVQRVVHSRKGNRYIYVHMYDRHAGVKQQESKKK